MIPFNPNEPQNGETVDADVLRAQLNALKALIDALPAGAITNPATVDLSLGNHNLVDVLSLAFGGNTILDLGGAQLKDGTPGGNSGAAISLRNRQLTNQSALPLADWSGNQLTDALGNAFLTPASAPVVRALDWGSNPPATLGEWMLRIAAVQSNNGANPIP